MDNHKSHVLNDPTYPLPNPFASFVVDTKQESNPVSTEVNVQERKAVVTELLACATAEVERLRQAGVSQQEFAQLLKAELLATAPRKLATVSKKTMQHPFFDYEAGCRKSAWDTPHHLSPTDWQAAQGLVEAAKSGSDFLNYLQGLNSHQKDALFYRVLGHPEAKHFMRDHEWVVTTFYPGIVKHYLERLRSACDDHLNNVNKLKSASQTLGM